MRPCFPTGRDRTKRPRRDPSAELCPVVVLERRVVVVEVDDGEVAAGLGEDHPVEVVVPSGTDALGQLDVGDDPARTSASWCRRPRSGRSPTPRAARSSTGCADRMTTRRGGSHSSTQMVSSATSSPSAVIRKVTDPVDGSPLHSPIQRASAVGLGDGRPHVLDRSAERALEDEEGLAVPLLASSGGAGLVGGGHAVSSAVGWSGWSAGGRGSVRRTSRSRPSRTDSSNRGRGSSAASQSASTARPARSEPVVPLAAAVLGLHDARLRRAPGGGG